LPLEIPADCVNLRSDSAVGGFSLFRSSLKFE